MSGEPVTMPQKESPKLGGWLMLSDPVVVETVAAAGFDFVGIDLQHGMHTAESAVHALQVLNSAGVLTYVRAAADQFDELTRMLDFGAAGLILAMVDTAEEVVQSLARTRYQPLGKRSYAGQRYGLRPEPPDPRDLEPEVHVMIETRAALSAIEEIAAVPGLSGMFAGPVDLGLALNLPFPARRDDSGYREALASITSAAAHHGLVAGSFATNGGDVAYWLQLGFNTVVVASDVSILRQGLARNLTEARR